MVPGTGLDWTQRQFECNYDLRPDPAEVVAAIGRSSAAVAGIEAASARPNPISSLEILGLFFFSSLTQITQTLG
jgi:hypothetical protein